MKTRIIIVMLLAVNAAMMAVTPQNFVFVNRDTCSLSMDVYTPKQVIGKCPCVIYVFGGGFKMGSKKEFLRNDLCKTLTDSGYIVAAIDYRLGMKGVNVPRVKRLKYVKNAIDMAVEDVVSATTYLLLHSNQLNVDPSKIILCGSSAGAITALQTDYELANRTALTNALPLSFRYAGVISFAGAILSMNGNPEYKNVPAPTMFFHGMEDKMVIYDKIQIMNNGLYGTNALAATFEAGNFPYYAFRYRGLGHEVATYPMRYNLNEICSFLRDYVINGLTLTKDITVKNPALKRQRYGNTNPDDLYK